MNSPLHRSATIAAALIFALGLVPGPSLAEEAGGDEAPQQGSLVEELVVTAEFRPEDPLDSPLSLTLLDEKAIEERSATHLEQLLNLAPNVNFSTGASRGRFFQVRGIGERSQFVEPVNPSVGLIIDGMDFTGIGGAATTLDLRQVEVLRGPQGTLFGANALAGVINLVSNAPSDALESSAEAIVGNYETLSVQAAVGGPAGDRLGWRFAVQSNQSEGFMDNAFLGRPTNDIDELTARGRLSWAPTDRFELDATLYVGDIDNGYDAFSLENTRETLSDQPGEDSVEFSAAALKARWDLAGDYTAEALVSHVDADSIYSYDEDWSFPGICEGTPCDSSEWGFDWWYSSFDAYIRSNANTTADLRLLSGEGRLTSWVGGLYFRDQEQTLLRDYTFAEGDFASRYDTENVAAYGQFDTPLGERFALVGGLRLERRTFEYTDNSAPAGPAGGAGNEGDEDFWGGRLALEYRNKRGHLVYGLVSRGYKPGGVNSALLSQLADLEAQGIEVPAENYLFDGESLTNYEVGFKGKARGERLAFSASLFYQDRDDVQVKQSIALPLDPSSDACPCVFIDSLQNAAGGVNQGLEAELDWFVGERWRVYGSLGLLDTEYRGYQSLAHAQADPENGIAYDLSGRDQAHAPNYQFVAGAEWNFMPGWSADANVEGKDGFFASPNHEVRTDSFVLLNARLAWSSGPWTIAAWGRNLNDEMVQTRAFGGFGNDPRDFYEPEAYYQFGEPRVFGISASWAD